MVHDLPWPITLVKKHCRGTGEGFLNTKNLGLVVSLVPKHGPILNFFSSNNSLVWVVFSIPAKKRVEQKMCRIMISPGWLKETNILTKYVYSNYIYMHIYIYVLPPPAWTPVLANLTSSFCSIDAYLYWRVAKMMSKNYQSSHMQHWYCWLYIAAI